MSSPGHIYVLINYSMENLVKVGKTTRDTESRSKELSSVTGVPTPFTVAFDAFFDDCDEAEEYVHEKLAKQRFRLSNNREFFRAPLKEVIGIIVEAQKFFESKQILAPNNNQKIEPDKKQESSQQSEKEPWSEIEAIAEYFLAAGNFEEAYRLYKQALNLGSKKSFYPLGCMTLKGWGCLEDAKGGLELLKEGVTKGDGRCCGEISNYYFYQGTIVSIRDKWFENYLKSGCFVNQQPDAGHTFFSGYYTSYIVDACLFLKINSVFWSVDYKTLLEKYRIDLSPIKEELIRYAIKRIDYVKKNEPQLKPIYLQIAQDIKNIL